MNHAETASRAPLAGTLAIVGGSLLAVGSFLAWAEVSGQGQSVTASGMDGSDGYITLAAGLLAIVGGIALSRATKRVLAVLVILAGIVGGGIGLYDALTAKDRVLDEAAEALAPTLGVPADEVRVVLVQAIDAGELSLSISIGLYVVIAGGVVALVGGILGLRGSATEREMASESAAPAPSAASVPPGAAADTQGVPPAPMPPPGSPPADPGN